MSLFALSSRRLRSDLLCEQVCATQLLGLSEDVVGKVCGDVQTCRSIAALLFREGWSADVEVAKTKETLSFLLRCSQESDA